MLPDAKSLKSKSFIAFLILEKQQISTKNLYGTRQKGCYLFVYLLTTSAAEPFNGSFHFYSLAYRKKKKYLELLSAANRDKS